MYVFYLGRYPARCTPYWLTHWCAIRVGAGTSRGTLSWCGTLLAWQKKGYLWICLYHSFMDLKALLFLFLFFFFRLKLLLYVLFFNNGKGPFLERKKLRHWMALCADVPLKQLSIHSCIHNHGVLKQHDVIIRYRHNEPCLLCLRVTLESVG